MEKQNIEVIKGTNKEVLKFLIGSNNQTKEVEYNIIETEFNKVFDGYSITKNEGYYLGQKENSCIVEIIVFKDIALNTLLDFTQNLKLALKQDSIYIIREFKNFIEV